MFISLFRYNHLIPGNPMSHNWYRFESCWSTNEVKLYRYEFFQFTNFEYNTLFKWNRCLIISIILFWHMFLFFYCRISRPRIYGGTSWIKKILKKGTWNSESKRENSLLWYWRRRKSSPWLVPPNLMHSVLPSYDDAAAAVAVEIHLSLKGEN